MQQSYKLVISNQIKQKATKTVEGVQPRVERAPQSQQEKKSGDLRGLDYCIGAGLLMGAVFALSIGLEVLGREVPQIERAISVEEKTVVESEKTTEEVLRRQ